MVNPLAVGRCSACGGRRPASAVKLPNRSCDGTGVDHVPCDPHNDSASDGEEDPRGSVSAPPAARKRRREEREPQPKLRTALAPPRSSGTRPPVATEAEGHKLLLSDASATGYKYVSRHADGSFIVDIRKGARPRLLSKHATAIAAAVVVAEAFEAQPEPEPPPGVEREAHGYQLFLSSKTASGYTGVYPSAWPPPRSADSRLPQGERTFFAKRQVGERVVHLGTFKTAVRAAVAYAQHVAGEQPTREEQEMRPLLSETPMPIEPVVTHAEGMRLHLSQTNPSGYKGVAWAKNRFMASLSSASHPKGQYLGRFRTAVEAAVAYAKAVQERAAAGPREGLVGEEQPTSSRESASQ